MANKMLIDASHPEETRVVVVRGNRVEEFDFEAENRKQLRGNIYLAKVTRVEPSLQAAFVDYGGNRHGFLAFSEIHPDYYQIPVADRQALIEAEEREQAEAEQAGAEDAEVHSETETAEPEGAESDGEDDDAEAAETSEDDAADGDEAGEPPPIAADAEPAETVSGAAPDPDADGDAAESQDTEDDDNDAASEDADGDEAAVAEAAEPVESVGAEDAMEELPVRPRARQRQYKIQEVIKRRQIMLVQVVKEERGNKGAALTTYLSLAGRYSVLMPNTARGGGISRKITSVADRKRLKQVVSDLDMPQGMGVILRTAGASRTKAEVKRDFEYLLRLWENVRELTLNSSAPTMVYEEGSLIKRSIRDLYNKEIDEVLVNGDDAYREAKDFMRMLMPSHAKNVKLYKDVEPLFARNGIEAQLDAMFSPQVTLKSGGYIVINQTEALVSVDVNSGRSTREHNIEDTALRTNLEAAEEVARQLRLRDLAGLVVIDFIDMDEKRNNRSVERKLKDALKHDRARIQVGRISAFGLLEMSRQRLRTGVLESTTTVCTTCHGAGRIRSEPSVALHVLRALEDGLLKSSSHDVTVRTKTPVALYVLNNKRNHLSQLEQRFGLAITVEGDDTLSDGAHFAIERGELATPRDADSSTIRVDSVAPEIGADDEDDKRTAAAEALDDEESRRDGEPGEDGKRKRRRRRRRSSTTEQPAAEAASEDAAEAGEQPAESAAATAEEDEETRPKRRRRGRRGGRRTRRGGAEAAADAAPEAGTEDAAEEGEPASAESQVAATEDAAEEGEPASAESQVAATEDEAPALAAEAEAEADTGEAAAGNGASAPDEFAPVNGIDAPESPDDGDTARPIHVDDETAADTVAEGEAEVVNDAAETEAEPTAAPEPPADDGDRPKRRGWWQRRTFF